VTVRETSHSSDHQMPYERAPEAERHLEGEDRG